MVKLNLSEPKKAQLEAIEAEEYLSEHYEFRLDELSTKTEFRCKDNADENWHILDERELNSLVHKARTEGIGGTRLKADFEEIIHSTATPSYNPIQQWITELPTWDGKNRVDEFICRIPGITSEQTHFFSIWWHSMVAHWLGLDSAFANDCMPLLIGPQGSRKTTFCRILMPEALLKYRNDHFNFGSQYDQDLMLRANGLVIVDEFDSVSVSQQAKLKMVLSRNEIHGRTIFKTTQDEHKRVASFIGTTNEMHPLNDPTGSRRFICINIPKGMLIDTESAFDIEQIYAQLRDELQNGARFWFNTDEVKRIQELNAPFVKVLGMDEMLESCFRKPAKGEVAKPMSSKEILDVMSAEYPSLVSDHKTKVNLGLALANMKVEKTRHKSGFVYLIVPKVA